MPSIMEVFSSIGDMETMFLLAVIIGWCWNYNLGANMTLLVMFSASLNTMLNIIFHKPIPNSLEL